MRRSTPLLPRPELATTLLLCGLAATMARPPLAHAAAPQGAAASVASAVAWIEAAGEADMDRAFAQARAEKKPVLLYWGAKWCPPCNQLQATLFNRQDFINRSRHLVAVHLDGDLPGAQKLGARFKVRGYPTMILLQADGSEITRLPGEAEPRQVMNVLQLGLSGGRPVKAVLADARAGKTVTANEWRMLAFYAWNIDEAQLVPPAERPALLAQLSLACPTGERESATRLLLKALAESDDGKGIKADPGLRQRVATLLADPAASRAQMDVLANAAADITRALAPEPSAERQRLVRAFDAALQRLQADASLSRGDRQAALASRVALARLDQPTDALQPSLPSALVQEVKAWAARNDRDIRDGYERQAVVTGDAWLLGQAGQWADSDALLRANLAKSHSPYYLMNQLAGNARKLGRTADALGWYQKAFDASEGPATRLQWGAGYLSALVDLAPQDVARIEQVAAQLFKEAGQDSAAFHERSARSLQRVGQKLATWNKGGEHDAVIGRLKAQLGEVCGRREAADGQRATCEAVLKPA